jgi:hypothetical protein
MTAANRPKHSDIEDLFTLGDYLGLYNEAFGTSHKVGDVPKHPDRLILRLEALDGKFDHWRPAEILLRSRAKVEKLSQTTLSNFENLARKINETHAWAVIRAMGVTQLVAGLTRHASLCVRRTDPPPF